MTAPDKIWIAGPASECGHYYPNATEAEGEHGGQAVEYTRSDLIAARPDPQPAAEPMTRVSLADLEGYGSTTQPAADTRVVKTKINWRDDPDAIVEDDEPDCRGDAE